MADNNNSNNDAAEIDVNNRHEVEALHQEWKQFSHAQIVDAINAYGPNKKNIEEHLRKKAEVL